MDVDFQAKPELCFNFVDKIQSYANFYFIVKIQIYAFIFSLKPNSTQNSKTVLQQHPDQILISKIQIVTHKSYELAPLLQTLAFVSLVCVNQLRDPKDVWVVLAHPGIKANFVR
jgi:hypothetical protein